MLKNVITFSLCLNLLLFSLESISQVNTSEASIDPDMILSDGYYVVIGAYSPRKEYYAKAYTNRVKKMGYEPSYGYSPKKKLFFVYLSSSGYYKDALNDMRKARKTEEFHDSWVFVSTGSLRNNRLNASNNTTEDKSKETEKDAVDLKNESAVSANNTSKDSSEDKNNPSSVDTATDNETSKEDKSVSEAMNTDEESEATLEKQKEKESTVINSLSDANVFFNLYNARNLNNLNGEVQVIDAERSKLMEALTAGDTIMVKDPKNGTGELIFICDIFGYRKAQIEMNYYNPVADTTNTDISLNNNTFLIDFDLVRYHAGDIVTMYNVYFFKDAALMKPSSKFEIAGLLEMMHENPDYRIKIHGHVNGKHPGKIISKGDSKEFFGLAEGNKEGFGSANELSEKRAELIRDYLVEQGIDKGRMEIKSWGGRRMLHEKHGSKAHRNVRVEIEILKD